MNDNTEIAQGSYREDGKTILYTHTGTPPEWIDEAGMPSGAFENLAEYIAAEVAQGRDHSQIQLGFLYHHKGRPYAAVARTHPYEGITIRVNYLAGVADVTPSRLSVIGFGNLARDVESLLDNPSMFEYERLRENLSAAPVWRLTKTTSKVIRIFDPISGVVLSETSRPSDINTVNMSAYRPATKIAAIHRLLKLLRKTPYAWERRNERAMRDIRLTPFNGIRSNSEFDKNIVMPLTAEDVSFYDSLIDSIADVGDNWERYYRTLARVAQFAHMTLPTVCRQHVLQNLWRQVLVVPFSERFGSAIDDARPSFGAEFARNYGLAIQNFGQPLKPGEAYTEEGYVADLAQFLDLIIGKQ